MRRWASAAFGILLATFATDAVAQCGKISTCGLASTPLSGTESLYIVQGGVSKRILVSAFQSAQNITAVGTLISGAINWSGNITTSGALTLSGMTAGSIPYFGTGGLFSQDNANLFYKASTHHLLLGTATDAAAPGYRLFIVPTAASLEGGIAVAQNVHGTNSTGGLFMNSLSLTADDATVTSNITPPFSALNGYYFSHFFGGSNLQGGRNTVNISSYFTGATNAANVNRNYVALFPFISAQAPDNGTGGARKGAFFATNPYAQALAAATNLFELTGGEVDMDARAGSSMDYKAIWSLITLGTDAVQGSVYDCALCISGATGTVGLKSGILFGNMNSAQPMNANGKLFETTGSSTITSGFEISSYTFTSYVFHSTPFSVQGDGQTGINVGALNGGVTITSTGQPRLALNQSGGISAGLYSDANALIFFDFTNAAERARLNSTGLGIGVSPTAKLDVAGTFKVSAGVTTTGLPASAGAGGLYVCVDNVGVQYKKSACP